MKTIWVPISMGLFLMGTFNAWVGAWDRAAADVAASCWIILMHMALDRKDGKK